MTLFAVLAIMAISCVALLAVASTVQIDIQREKEQEAIYRGEEVAEAIRQYVEFYRGAKLPQSMNDKVEKTDAEWRAMTDFERDRLNLALLKYCELDTLAMVMIYEAWKAVV